MMGSSVSASPAHQGAITRGWLVMPVLAWRRCLYLVVVLFAAMQLWSASAHASETRYVDGISDQNMNVWEGGFSGSYFHSFFQEGWVKDGHIKLARLVVQWHNWEAEGLVSWLDDVASMGLTPDITVTKWKSEELFPDESEYKTQLTAIIKDAENVAGSVYIEPWNEPNAQGELGKSNESKTKINEGARKAAEYANWAHEVCVNAGTSCTLVAGNFEDSAGTVTYAKDYMTALNFRPKDWGIHPYKAVETGEDGEALAIARSIKEAYAPEEIKIWITEINTRECSGSPASPELQGGQRANYIVNTLMLALKPEHVFYYEFLNTTSACSNREEGQLFVPSNEAGAPQDRPRPAAAYIYEDKGFPWGYTGEAKRVTLSSATLTGSIYPGGSETAKYYFEYGTTSSYGSSSAEGNAGSGTGRVAVELGVGSLKPGTTYHYRVVARNAEGVDYGADKTFTTPVVYLAAIDESEVAWGREGVVSEWSVEHTAVKQVAMASDPSNGVLMGVLDADGTFWAKAGGLSSEWVEEAKGVKEIAVASDSTHGPLLGYLSTEGMFYAKEGLSDSIKWVEQHPGVVQIAVASDPINGPLLGYLSTEGMFYAKQGGLGAEWVEQHPGVEQIAVASDPINGPLLGYLSTEGMFYAKEGGLYTEWVEQHPGVEEIVVASDSTHGPLLGYLGTEGMFYAKEGGLYTEWVEQHTGASQISVASESGTGPVLGYIDTAGTLWAKAGGLAAEWNHEYPNVTEAAVAAD